MTRGAYKMLLLLQHLHKLQNGVRYQGWYIIWRSHLPGSSLDISAHLFPWMACV